MKTWYQLQPVKLLSMAAIKCFPPIYLFHEINEMPIIMELARLDDGGGIEDTWRKNQAHYHSSCLLMFNVQTWGRFLQCSFEKTMRNMSGSSVIETSEKMIFQLLCYGITTYHGLWQPLVPCSMRYPSPSALPWPFCARRSWVGLALVHSSLGIACLNRDMWQSTLDRGKKSNQPLNCTGNLKNGLPTHQYKHGLCY